MALCVDLTRKVDVTRINQKCLTVYGVAMNTTWTVIPNNPGLETLKNIEKHLYDKDDELISDTIDDTEDNSDEFIKDLEERIQADLEIETIFSAVPQPRSFSLGKSLPERPCNPIIKDKFFKNEDWDNLSMPNTRAPMLDDRHVYMSKYRDFSLERQRIILQEDFEAVNEIHQLLLSSDSNSDKNKISKSKTSCSELSSLETNFSRMHIDENWENH